MIFITKIQYALPQHAIDFHLQRMNSLDKVSASMGTDMEITIAVPDNDLKLIFAVGKEVGMLECMAILAEAKKVK